MSFGTVTHASPDFRYYFVCPEGCDERDREKSLFMHGKAVELAGIRKDAMRPGTRIEFDVVPSTKPGATKDVCQNIKLRA
jgi:cold shock CspA family protein